MDWVLKNVSAYVLSNLDVVSGFSTTLAQMPKR